LLAHDDDDDVNVKTSAVSGPGPETRNSSIMASNVTINISPSPGFCIKSKVLHLDVTSHEQTHRPVPISEGLKVFVNIAWSKDVPPPLDGIEKASEFSAHSGRIVLKSERDSPIPVFASNARLNTDKGTSVTRAYGKQTLRALEPVIHFRINSAHR
jgi:hypothetical protein